MESTILNQLRLSASAGHWRTIFVAVLLLAVVVWLTQPALAAGSAFSAPVAASVSIEVDSVDEAQKNPGFDCEDAAGDEEDAPHGGTDDLKAAFLGEASRLLPNHAGLVPFSEESAAASRRSSETFRPPIA